MTQAIEVRSLNMHYDHKPVLSEVDFSLPEGRTIAIVGPNGAGKSTLLKGMMGLQPLARGEVRYFGQPLKKKRLTVAYVPQREEIDWDFPIKVFDVVLMGRFGHLSLLRRPGARDRAIARQALEQVSLQDFAERQISQLSGGQQQRVFLARALAQRAGIYLMDEPFAGVDVATEKAIIELFRDLRGQGKTIVCVHHDLNTVPEYYDWTVLVNGRVIAAGPTGRVFNQDNLNLTYGGRLALLSELTEKRYRAGLGG